MLNAGISKAARIADYTVDGNLLVLPTMAGPFAGVNVEIFNGNGTLTGHGMVSLNGEIAQQSYTGTYTVNPNCTGTYTVEISPFGLTTHAFFVIADGGNELQVVIKDPGNVITCIARKQFPVGSSEQ